MISVLYAILGFVVAVGLLTIVHEYGHFWVARRLGVKVLRFSVGFGKVIFSRRDKLGTEYALCAVPLGGYVKMLDQNEGTVAPADLHLSFNRQPVWARMLIIAAGPLMNFIFAILAYWLMFIWGISSIVPIIGEVPVGTVAYKAGLHSGQEITAIDNNPTPTWEDIAVNLVGHVGDHDTASITVRDTNDNAVSTHTLNLTNWHIAAEDQNLLQDLGLVPYDPLQPIVGNLLPGYPAATVGLQPGDRIISFDHQPVQNITQVLDLIQNKYDQNVQLTVERKDQTLTFNITPIKKLHENGLATGFIGVEFAKQVWPAKYIRIQRFGPLPAFGMACERTKEFTVVTLQFLGKMLTGKMSLQHLSGPIAIAQYAGITVRAGTEYFMGFLALVSISLGVLNMLPIPILDGGHFLFCVIELIRGKALSLRTMNIGMAFGLVILGSIMLLAICNDVLRILH